MGRRMRDFAPRYKIIGDSRYTLLGRYYIKSTAYAIAEQWRNRQGYSVRIFNVPGTHEYRLYGRMLNKRKKGR